MKQGARSACWCNSSLNKEIKTKLKVSLNDLYGNTRIV